MTDRPAVRIDPIPDRFARSLTIAIADAPPPAQDPAVERVWRELTDANPRYFDGPILSVRALALDRGRVDAAIDSYKRLAVRPAVQTDAQLLSVTGVVTARDARGAEHALLGRRAGHTRSYPHMWEFAPAGGLHPPVPARDLTHRDLLDQLRAEMAEETGLSPDLSPAAAVAVLHDPAAHSFDIILRINAAEPLEQLIAAHDPARWEYEQVLWLPVAGADRFDRDHADETIPPTRALMRFLGWVKP